MGRPCPLPEPLWISWSFFAENPLQDGKWVPWPVGDRQPLDSKGSKDTTVAKILTEVPLPLRWQQLGMTPVSSVTPQESICARAYRSQGVMTRWGLFLASRKKIFCSCRSYWTLGSNMPSVRSADMPCWATVIFNDTEEWKGKYKRSGSINTFCSLCLPSSTTDWLHVQERRAFAWEKSGKEQEECKCSVNQKTHSEL